MADAMEVIISTIRSAIYGRDMREAIARGFELCGSQSGSIVNIDKTLTLSDYAADSKVVGDRFVSLEADIEAINPGLSREEKDAILAYFQEQVDIHPELSNAYQVIYDLWNVPVSSITLSKNEMNLAVGMSDYLTATILPKEAYDQTVVWTVEPEGIVTVNDGTVSGVSEGDAVITATCGGKQDQCSIHCEQVEIYSITNSLTNYKNSNGLTQIAENNSYNAILTVDEGYKAGTVNITMGGQNITSSAYDSESGTITISKVTGNIVITATAVKIVYHTITYNLTGCASSPKPVSVEDGTSFSVTISKNDQSYIFSSKKVTMGASDITSSSISESYGSALTVNISSVTDNVTLLFKAEAPKSFSEYTWAELSAISSSGQAANLFSVGDTKPIKLNGTINSVNRYSHTYNVVILGINHNSELEGDNLIHLGLGYESGKLVVLAASESEYGLSAPNDATFTMATLQNNNVYGWLFSDIRDEVFGGDELPEHPPSEQRSGTLWSILPKEFCDVLKPCDKYSAIKYIGSNFQSVFNKEEAIGKHIEYGVLPSEFEITGLRKYANQYEQNYQKQYDFFKNGNSKFAYLLYSGKSSISSLKALYWTRSRTTDETGDGYQGRSDRFVAIYSDGTSVAEDGETSMGAFPIVFL